MKNEIANSTLYRFFLKWVQISLMDLYFTPDKNNYRLVGEFDEMAEGNDFDLFTYLARKFEHVSGGLRYMKQVYFAAERNLKPFDNLFGNIILS